MPAPRVGCTGVVRQVASDLGLSCLIPLYPSIPICLSVLFLENLCAPRRRGLWPSFDDGRRVGAGAQSPPPTPRAQCPRKLSLIFKLTSDYPKRHPSVTRGVCAELATALNSPCTLVTHRPRAQNVMCDNPPLRGHPMTYRARALKRNPKWSRGHTLGRTCRVCGLRFRSRRLDAITCSSTCR